MSKSLQPQSYVSLFFVVCTFAILSATETVSQVIVSESFDNVQFVPLGWSSGKVSGVDPNNFVERVSAGVLPITTTHSGVGMVRYRSGYMNNPGEQFFMASPAYDLTNNPGTATLSFWIYRDNSNTVQDSLSIYINDSATANLQSMTLVGGPVTRAGGTNSWVQFSYLIPPGFNAASACIIFVFTSQESTGTKANIYFDDFSITTYPKPQVVVSSAICYQEVNDINKGATDQLIAGIKVVCSGAGVIANNTRFRIDSIVTNVTGTSLLTDLAANGCKIWYTKGTSTCIKNGNQFGNAVNPTFFRDCTTPTLAQTPFYLENGDNYFWITLSTSGTAVAANWVDVDFNGIYYRYPGYGGVDTSQAPVVSSLPGGRQIDVAFCNGVIPVLPSGTSWSNYNNNDYIQRVYLRGANATNVSYPYLDNNVNDVGPNLAPWYGGPAPFTVHPPDYQQLPQTASALHPHITAVLVQGVTYGIPSLFSGNPVGAGLALQFGTFPSGNYMAAWIDFNKDGDLMDVGEKIHQSLAMLPNTWTFAPVNVPFSQTPPTPNVAGPSGIVFGNVKMRVREVWVTPNIDPCMSGGSYWWGETEDYFLTILPTCQTGIKLWLGYTDDWNTPSNWCGGVPTINDVALIDEVGFLGGQSGAAFEPVIHSGTLATAKTIRLGAGDSLMINSPVAGSLQIADSLAISYNTPAGGNGYFKVNTAFGDTAQLFNGNLMFNITPFQGSRKGAKSQLIYKKADLLAKGMTAGDVIDQLIFHVRLKPNPTVAIYNNFTIKYATVDSTWGGFPPPGPTGFGSAGTVWAPNTSAFVNVYGPVNFNMQAAVPGTQGSFALTLNSAPANMMRWNGVSDIVIEICFENQIVASAMANDLLYQTQTTGSFRFAWASSGAATAPFGCSLAPVTTGTFQAVSSQYRPNITFHYKRLYDKYPVNITGNGAVTSGNWVNNGTFLSGWSNVTFSNGSMNQYIGGSNISTFNELTINKAGSTGVLMNLNANVDSFLVLNNGYLDLNQNLMTVNNSMVNAIQRTAPAWLQSENLPATYGRLSKKIGTITGTHLFPFGTTSGAWIPFSIGLTSGDMGYVTVATFSTAADNTPYANNATGPGTVTHMQDLATGLDLSVNYVANRFWQINKTGPSGTANMVFTITTPERALLAGAANGELKAQRWINPNANGNPGWFNFSTVVPTHIAATNTVTMPGMTIFDGPWTLSHFQHPLPVELLQFDAKLVNDKVKIWWSTASEKDNDYFTVERTIGGDTYSFIDRLESKGPSSQMHDYSTYDYSPVTGIQYYRLKTTDIQGNADYSPLVAVKYSKPGDFSISYVQGDHGNNELQVVFSYNSNEPFTYTVTDMLGRIMASHENNQGTQGVNSLRIPVSMNRGIYVVMLENSCKRETAKITY